MFNLSVLLVCPPTTSQLENVEQYLSQYYDVSSSNIDHHPDIHIINSQDDEGEYKPVQIAEVRALLSSMSLAPYQGVKPTGQALYILLMIDQASLPAQNALLKSLEEPAPHAQLILSTTQIEKVLPTITSRCTTIVLEEKATPSPISADQQAIFSRLSALKYHEIFALSEEYKERAAAQSFIGSLMQWLYQKNQLHPQLGTTTQLQILTTAQDLLGKNVNPRLVLENVLFQFTISSAQTT